MNLWNRLLKKSRKADDEVQEIHGKELSPQMLGVLPLASGKLFIGDGQMAPYEPGIIVDLEPGPYEVYGQQMDFRGDLRVSLMRIVRAGSVYSRAEQLGESWADTATQGVCDYELYVKAMEDKDEEEYFSRYEDQLLTDDFATITLDDGGPSLILCRSGFGDGIFPVYELVSGDVRVGVDIQMISPGEPHPFPWSIKYE